MGIQFDGINNEIKSQTKIDFPGSIGIAGTLTYEDVTSVDSIGIITARTGVIVGSGVTLNATGVIATGVVTATSFSGSGANLTGISAGTSLSGSTNNQVTTVTGANAIQGESNLTFDGTNLSVTGNVSLPDSTAPDYVGNIYVGNNSDLKIFHNGSDNFIRSGAGNHNIRIDNNGGVLGARFIPGGSSELYHNGTKKLSTTANGICFNSDTAADNALDDYEEGTYVPSTNTGLTLNSSYNTFSYIKIGRCCTVRGLFYPNNNPSGSDVMSITLPFASYNYTGSGASIAGAGGSGTMYRSISGADAGVAAYISDNVSIATFYKNGSNGGAWSPVRNNDWNNAMEIYVDFTYFTV